MAHISLADLADLADLASLRCTPALAFDHTRKWSKRRPNLSTLIRTRTD